MNKFTTGEKDDADTQKLVPKGFEPNSKDGKLFRQKNEEKAVIVTKVTTYQLKIMASMDELMLILNKPSTFIDPIDHFKQRKLFADFIARFSRNYIYEIDRIIEEIQYYHVEHYSYFERSTNHLIAKVCNLFAVILRALQIYRRQLVKMNNENSEKLLHFVELIVVGINVSIELKIFDGDDLLIKLLLDKSEEFTAFLRRGMFDESQPEAKPPILALAKEMHIPTTNRYGMYAPKSKKVKPGKPIAALAKTNRNGKCSTNVNQQQQRRCGQHIGKVQTMFESQVCRGESSTCDAYEVAVQQNDVQVNDQYIPVGYCTLSESEQETQNEVEKETEIEIATTGPVSDLLDFEFDN